MMKTLSRIAFTALIATACFLAGCEQSEEVLQLPERPTAAPQPIPDFNSAPDIATKKRTYFEYMKQKVRMANDEVWRERQFVLALSDKLQSSELHEEEINSLQELSIYYRLEAPTPLTPDFLDQLLRRVDVVPASLVLAQSANESAWGSSRFAREGNNFFGIWCYEKGCGITPSRRDPGAKQEVRKFPTVQDGVRYYVRTINSGESYAELRDIRAELRAEEKPPTGMLLAQGLTLYSERGEEYVNEIQAMIRQNKLQSYTIRRSEDEDAQ